VDLFSYFWSHECNVSSLSSGNKLERLFEHPDISLGGPGQLSVLLGRPMFLLSKMRPVAADCARKRPTSELDTRHVARTRVSGSCLLSEAKGKPGSCRDRGARLSPFVHLDLTSRRHGYRREASKRVPVTQGSYRDSGSHAHASKGCTMLCAR
jgi:hypothetical protein